MTEDGQNTQIFVHNLNDDEHESELEKTNDATAGMLHSSIMQEEKGHGEDDEKTQDVTEAAREAKKLLKREKRAQGSSQPDVTEQKGAQSTAATEGEQQSISSTREHVEGDEQALFQQETVKNEEDEKNENVTPSIETAEEGTRPDGTAAIGKIEPKEAVTAKNEPVAYEEDFNANVEMPVVTKTLASEQEIVSVPQENTLEQEIASETQKSSSEQETVLFSNVISKKTERQASAAIEEMVPEVEKEQENRVGSISGVEAAGEMVPEVEKEQEIDANPVPTAPHAVVEPLQNSQKYEKREGQAGHKKLEDPHGVQEVMDSSGSLYEDSQPLHTNFSTTTAYRVAIKKKRYTTIGDTLFLMFCVLVLVGVVVEFVIYLPRFASVFEVKTSVPTAVTQSTQPINKAGVLSSLAGAETTAPTANGTALAGYQWIHEGSKHALYVDANNHIQELVTSDEQIWQITDLTKRSGAAISNGRILAGFAWQHGDSEQVVYVDSKGHVQQLAASNDGQWNVSDLTRKATAPLANGNAIVGYEWSVTGSKQVVYIDQNNHIQELMTSDGSNWRVSDLTDLTNAPLANGNIVVGYQWTRSGSKQVVYIDQSNHVQELSYMAGSWHLSDLSIIAGAPPANGRTLVGYEWQQTGAKIIAYLDMDNHIRLLSSVRPGNWSLIDLTRLVKAPIANGNTLVGYEWQQGGRNVLYFIDSSNRIEEMSDVPGEDWQLADLNQLTQVVPPPNGRVLVGHDWAQHGSKQVVYIDNTNVVEELTSGSQFGKWTLSSWKHS
ncbi:MAG: hypothetical protein PVSMB5_29460 [Ktedonobacteraceae bacterium]